MRKLKSFILTIAAAFALSSCTTVYSLYNKIDFVPLELDEAYSDPHSVVLRSSAQIEFSNNSAPLPLYDPNATDIFDSVQSWTKGKDYNTGTISAGTKVKILAVILPDNANAKPMLFSRNVRYLVETQDGRRGTAFIPQAVEGLMVPVRETGELMTVSRVRAEAKKEWGRTAYDYYFRMKEDGKEYTVGEIDFRLNDQLPVYRYGLVSFIKQKQLDRIEGKTLPEVEALIEPTYNISSEGGRLVANFPFIYFEKDDASYSNLKVPLVRKNGVYVAGGYELAGEQKDDEFSALTNFIAKFTIYTFRISSKNLATEYGYSLFPRFGSFNTFLVPGMLKIVVGVILGFILYLILFLLVIPKIARSIFYIKPLTNKQVAWIAGTIYFVLFIASIVYFGMFDIISLIFVIMVMRAMYCNLFNELDLTRCETCHEVGSIVQVDKKVHMDVTTSEQKTKTEQVVDHVVRHTRVTKTKWETKTHTWDEPIYRSVQRKYVLFSRRIKWTDYYQCSVCGQKVNYKRSSTETWTRSV